MKDTATPRDAAGPPPPKPKLGAAGRASMDGSAAKEAKPIASEAMTPRPRDFAKRPDIAEKVTPEQKEELRKLTPSAEIREKINDVPKSQKIDPVYGYKVDRLEADHIVPFNKVCDMKGFGRLGDQNQKAVLNDERNFMGLDRRTNASKSDKSWAEWSGHPELGPVPDKLRKQMVAREQVLEKELQAEIDRRLAGKSRRK